MKNRKSFSETRRKFRVKFPGRPVPNPNTIRRQAKRIKETGSVKNRKVNRRRHLLTEETLDDIGERLEQQLSKTFIAGNLWSIQRATKLLKLLIRIVNIHTFTQGMSQIAIITITTLTALMYNNNHNQ